MAVAERACRVADEPTETAAVVRGSLSGVTARAGAAAAVNAAGDRGHFPALNELLGSHGLFPVAHLHVIFGVEVIIATETLHSTHVRIGNDEESYAVPVVVQLHSKVSLDNSEPAACVKMDCVVVEHLREVGELTIDLIKIIMEKTSFNTFSYKFIEGYIIRHM